MQRWQPIFTWLGVPVAILVFYFMTPLRTGDAPLGDALGFTIGATCLLAFAWIITAEVRGAKRRLRPVHLLLAFEVVLIIFSITYYTLNLNHPGEFYGLTTRLDALYFSLATMATVGFGDVHAQGQLARAIVTSQMAFNLVFVGAAVALLQEQFRSGAFHRNRARKKNTNTDNTSQPADDPSASTKDTP